MPKLGVGIKKRIFTPQNIHSKDMHKMSPLLRIYFKKMTYIYSLVKIPVIKTTGEKKVGLCKTMNKIGIIK